MLIKHWFYLSLFLLSSCGFHLLNGSQPLPVCIEAGKPIADVDNNINNSPTLLPTGENQQAVDADSDEATLYVINHYIHPVCGPKSAKLKISRGGNNSQILTTSSNNTINQTLLTRQLSIELTHYPYKEPPIKKKFAVQKMMVFNNNAILNSGDEKRILGQEMDDALMNQLKFYLQQTLVEGKSAPK